MIYLISLEKLVHFKLYYFELHLKLLPQVINDSLSYNNKIINYY